MPVSSIPVREWYAQIAEASKTPGLAQHLVRRTGELLPRFVHFHDWLRALPRRLRRSILRRRGFSLAAAAMLLAIFGGTIRAATIHVDSATCTLPDAILASNADAAQGGCPAGSGDDILVLDSDVTLGADLPSIDRTTRIEAGLGSVIDGGGHGCIYVGYPSGDVTLSGLTIRNCEREGGAAVFNYSANLTIESCTITGNHATGGFLYGGGALQNFYGTATITGSTITGNTAAEDGGGIMNSGGFLTVRDSVLSGNTAGNAGGGINNFYSAVAFLTNCVISGNEAATGGGVAAGSDFGGGLFDMTSSTISGNTATNGGGMRTYYGDVVARQSTISGNSATASGGGIYFAVLPEGSRVTLTNVTVSNNTAGTEGGGILGQGDFSELTLEHALITGNDAPSGAELSLHSPLTTTVNDHNLVGYDGSARSTGLTLGANDIVPAAGVLLADILAPLADNGGPTQTHALVAGSPAVDAIPTSDGNCLGTTDQRGVARPVGTGCDTGSFELEAEDFTFGGSVTGFTPKKVICSNRSTRDHREAKISQTAWDCEALGLAVSPGDEVRTSSAGVAASVAIRGKVTAMTPSAVFCENATTGQKVKELTSASTWDCEALGLVVTPGDRVSTGASGTID